MTVTSEEKIACEILAHALADYHHPILIEWLRHIIAEPGYTVSLDAFAPSAETIDHAERLGWATGKRRHDTSFVTTFYDLAAHGPQLPHFTVDSLLDSRERFDRFYFQHLILFQDEQLVRLANAVIRARQTGVVAEDNRERDGLRREAGLLVMVPTSWSLLSVVTEVILHLNDVPGNAAMYAADQVL